MDTRSDAPYYSQADVNLGDFGRPGVRRRSWHFKLKRRSSRYNASNPELSLAPVSRTSQVAAISGLKVAECSVGER